MMETVASTVGTMALEIVIEQFLKIVVYATHRAVQYAEILSRIQTRVTAMAPLVKMIEKLSITLDRPNEDVEGLVSLLRSGEALVKKCTEGVHWWNCCINRPLYAGELLKLEENLNRYLQETLPLQLRRDVMEMNLKLYQISTPVAGNGGHGGSAVPEAPKFVVGLEVHLAELKARLLRRSDIQLIIVSAPGGCGKTTLIKKLCHDGEIKGHFRDQIYYVTVTQRLDVKGIVRRIFQQTENMIPEFQSDEDAVNQLGLELRRKATKGPILLVLDDVWSGAEALIEKFQFEIEGYKILVTSRSVFLRFNSTYTLTRLNREDAMRLFLRAAELHDGDTDIRKEIAEKIVEGCKGLPLALSVVGRSLCRQPLAVWKKKEQDWSSGAFKFDSEPDIINCLSTSLEVLNGLAKQCFLDLASFPEDQRIPVTTLIDMWEELYFDEDGVNAMVTIYNLCNQNLASLTVTRGYAGEVDNWHDRQFVTQHDLLRDLAIYQAADEAVGLRERLIAVFTNGSFPDWWKGPRIHPSKARLISITTDETFSSNWPDLEAPSAEVLVLNFQSKNYTLPDFIEKLQKVKVLIAKNYGFYSAELSNFHLIASLSALRRIRLERVSIPCLEKSPTQLHNLQKVSLVMCKIDLALKNRETSLSYVFPNLVEINIDYCDDLKELPEDICELCRLQRLSITNCHNLSSLPQEIGKLVNLEVLRLTSCIRLEKLPDSIGSLGKLTVLDISDCFDTAELPDKIGSLQNLRKLYMSKCFGLQKLPGSMANLVQLEVICDEERADLWGPLDRRPKIKILKEDINLHWLYD